VELRPTAVDDLPSLHAIFTDAVRELFSRHGFAPPAPSLEAFSAIQRHIRETGLSVVAEEAGRVVGFGAAWTRGDDWFLASLFVSPSVQAAGVGSALLDAAWGSAQRRRTLTDAIQPVSNALYARRGLVPSTPMLTFAGTPRRLAVVSGEEAPADLTAIDAAAYGFDREVDHRHWERIGRRTTWGDAYSYAFPGGDIGPVAGATPAAAARALAAELDRATGPVRVRVPGSARALVEVALAARLQLDAVPGLLLLSDGVPQPTALCPSGYVLF
jgi:GNAT superfamily N-acetyltransferase